MYSNDNGYNFNISYEPLTNIYNHKIEKGFK